MSRTTFYAIDEEYLPRHLWDLADTFAELHSLAAIEPDGVAHITIADLRILLDCCALSPSASLAAGHRAAIARVMDAIDVLPGSTPREARRAT